MRSGKRYEHGETVFVVFEASNFANQFYLYSFFEWIPMHC